MWLLALVCYGCLMIVYKHLAYKASLGYVASSTCVLFALRVCSFTGSVLCKASIGYVASSTCVLFALRVCSFTGGVLCKASLGYVASSTSVLFALRV
jgi:hypothetical protein